MSVAFKTDPVPKPKELIVARKVKNISCLTHQEKFKQKLIRSKKLTGPKSESV